MNKNENASYSLNCSLYFGLSSVSCLFIFLADALLGYLSFSYWFVRSFHILRILFCPLCRKYFFQSVESLILAIVFCAIQKFNNLIWSNLSVFCAEFVILRMTFLTGSVRKVHIPDFFFNSPNLLHLKFHLKYILM